MFCLFNVINVIDINLQKREYAQCEGNCSICLFVHHWIVKNHSLSDVSYALSIGVLNQNHCNIAA